MNFKLLTIAIFFMLLLNSCQAIGDIFSAGVWIGLTIALAVIIILFAVFRKK